MIQNFFKSSFTVLIFKDRFLQIAFGLALIINLTIWVLLYFRFLPLRDLGDLLPLHYNIYFGIDFVGKWYKIFVMPLAGIFFIIVNFFLADILYLRDKVVGYFLGGASVFIQALLFLAALVVVLVNQ